jgi:hypothetical protein
VTGSVAADSTAFQTDEPAPAEKKKGKGKKG